MRETILQLATQAKRKIAVAESCTGGMLASALTDLPGSSAIFERGFVTYSNAAKIELLGVSADTLARHGAVSEPVAKAMASGALDRSGGDIALSITG
ncbi:MAG: CinA family protein, partial [Paracoccaceae bacterium]